MLCSCGEKEQAEETTITVAEDAVGELGIPLSADFGGDEYRVLSAGNVAYKDFTFEDNSSVPLDVAQYKRKALVGANYNVDIVEDVKTSYSSENGHGFKSFYSATASGTDEYDVGLIAGYDVSVLGYCGCLYDMNSIPDIDLSKSWWDRKANEALTIHDLVFFTVGDYTLSNNDAAYVIMFKKLLEEINF